jgi:hypothetical protein
LSFEAYLDEKNKASRKDAKAQRSKRFQQKITKDTKTGFPKDYTAGEGGSI